MTTKVVTDPWKYRTSLNLVQVYYDGVDTDDGDVAYLNLGPLYAKGQVNLGVMIQAIAASVAIDITLYDPEIAANPDHAENVDAIWSELDSDITDSCVQFFNAATAMRFRFLTATPGQVIVGTC